MIILHENPSNCMLTVTTRQQNNITFVPKDQGKMKMIQTCRPYRAKRGGGTHFYKHIVPTGLRKGKQIFLPTG